MKHRHIASLTATLIAALAAHPATADSAAFAPWDTYTGATRHVLPVTGTRAAVDRPWFQQALDVDLRIVKGRSVAHPESAIDLTPWFQKGQVADTQTTRQRERRLAGQ